MPGAAGRNDYHRLTACSRCLHGSGFMVLGTFCRGMTPAGLQEVRKLSKLQKEGSISQCQQCRLWGRWAKCGACNSVTYCSSRCQRRHWSAHKASCKADDDGTT